MAQYRKDQQRFTNNGNTIFDVVMLSTNTGAPISTTNRLPVSLGTGTITITGNVNVGTVVSVNSTPTNPVHTHITEVGTSGQLTVPYLHVHDVRVSNVAIRHSNGSLITTATPLPVTASTNNETIYAAPWDMQVARGKVAGVTQVNIFGYGTAIDGTFVPAWENATVYTFPASAVNMNVVSTSASDNTDASITISGLDSSWNLLTETIHLNGTTPVVTTNQFLRINSVLMMSAGTGQTTNVGTITLKNGSGTIHGQVNPGVSRMQNSWYSVPAGYGLYIQNINAFTGETKQGNTPTWMYYRVLVKDSTNGVQRTILQTSFQNEYKVQRFNPVKYSEKSDVEWQFSSSSGSVSLGLILEAVLISDTAP